jgi:CheY-like chemotaxis protein
MTITEVSIEMGISERQTYRDLKRGQGAIADILWSKFGAAGSDDLSLAPVQSEIARLKEHFQPIDLHDLLNNALSAVERLAVQHEVSMNVEIARPTPVISANAPIAQQILVKLLSFSIKQANPGPISIILTNTPEVISLTLQYTARLTAENEPNHVMDELISQLNWHFEQEHTAGITRLILRITAHNRVLLVIDDNEGVADLMTRYLAGYNCRVMSAKSGQEGLKLARKTQPDVILLDVMMPGMDGWELLQRLRSYPETETIPVVVCSVVNDPELSYSLGAAQVISKPVTQENLLNVLYTLKLI